MFRGFVRGVSWVLVHQSMLNMGFGEFWGDLEGFGGIWWALVVFFVRFSLFFVGTSFAVFSGGGGGVMRGSLEK